MTDRQTSDPLELARLYRLLDVGLDLDPGDRAAWLRRLPSEDQDLVPRLRELLGRHAVETDDFMRRNALEQMPDMAGDEPEAERAGQMVGPYRLLSRLGVGGMATVWLAERQDGAVARQVALKLPRAAWGLGLAKRLARERDILASLEHPLIAHLYDAGQCPDGRPWIAMEYVQGQPIDAYARSRRATQRELIVLFLQVLDVVSFAHARLVVHRDLKPGNVLVDETGKVRLLDFGVAKLLDESLGLPEEALTRLHGQPLTLEYASPEQVRRLTIGVASDVYSLGVILYELLTGRRPYRLKERTREAIERALLSDERPLASSMAVDAGAARALRGDLDAILDKAVRLDVSQRYSSAEAFAADLKRFLDGEPVLARVQSRRYRWAKTARRHRWPLVGATVVALSVLGGAASSLWHAHEAREQAALAQVRLRNAEGLLDFTNAVLMHGLKPGETVTLEELMRRSETVIVESLGKRPVDRALATEMLAEWHTLFGNTRKSRELLESALAQLPADADASLAERLRCLSAETLSFAGDPKQAFVELDQALARPSGDPSARIACELRRSNLERNASNKEEAMRWALAAEATLKRIDRPSVKVKAWVENELGNALVVAGKPAEGVRHLETAVEMLEQAGPSQDLTLIFTLTDRAISLIEAGQHLPAVRDLLRAERIASERLPGGDVPAGVLVNLGNALRFSGRLTQADDAYQRAALAAQRDRIPGMEAAAHLGLASTELARPSPRLVIVRHQLDTANKILDRVGMPEGAPVRGGIRHVKALVLVASGDLEKGDAELAELAQRYEKFNASSSMARTLAYRAEIALKRGDVDSASRLLATALERARRPQGDFETSGAVAHVLVWQAEVARRRGQVDAMSDLARQALHQAMTSAGEDHPAVLRAQTLLAR